MRMTKSARMKSGTSVTPMIMCSEEEVDLDVSECESATW